jgi:uncharacterized protein
VTIWAISDLHLSHASDKPMDVFGDHWEGHAEKIEANWRAAVADEDTVLIAGDISWGMTWEQALPDLEWIDRLPGTKLLIRGNHDYWWKKIKWMRENVPPSIRLLQNSHLAVEGKTICGTRGWTLPGPEATADPEDTRLFERERARLAMSLDSAKDRDETIVMMHYPPFASTGPDFTDILTEKNVSTVVYGHLHSDDARNAFSGERDGIRYVFSSCDGIDFSPVKLD